MEAPNFFGFCFCFCLLVTDQKEINIEGDTFGCECYGGFSTRFNFLLLSLWRGGSSYPYSLKGWMFFFSIKKLNIQDFSKILNKRIKSKLKIIYIIK
jgi:hypothetical protein